VSLPFLPLIRQPTLIHRVDDDLPIRPLDARIMQRLRPHATPHTYPDGHVGLVALADELTTAVARILAEASG